ncbi:hypothetical protein DB88DRAFT_512054 [Papiliotrema laurentii]|uniref:Uncharacterized protein n=1 Tax=Papiliotrema laurentii TaxID=5418 RepID=A0AAD9CVW5_PAPLA|nr:hypothetical protein DB88DRAFT_512054 [Papiliotrema laurentii]
MTTPVTEEEIKAVFADKAKFSLGCMFAQVVIDTFFAGVLTMQVINYCKYQRGDKWWTKFVVVFAIALNAAITVYLWVFIQYLFVENFGLWAPFAQTRWLAPFPFLDALNSGAIQAFFSYRAWRLTYRFWPIPIICGILILTSIGATLAVWIIFSRSASLFLAADVTVPENLWLSSIMAADIIITISNDLSSHPNDTRVPGASYFEPASLFGSTLQGIQPKLYAMGLMYALNQRVTFRSTLKEDDPSGNQVYALSGRPSQKTIQVEVATDTWVHTETVVPGPPLGLNRGYREDEDKQRDLESLSDPANEGQRAGYGSNKRLTR